MAGASGRGAVARRTRLPRFVAEFALALAVIVLLHPFLLPLWSALGLTLANQVLGLGSLRIESDAAGGWTAVRTSDTEAPTVMVEIPSDSLVQIYLGFVLLPALLAATPVAWRRRAALVAAGCGLLLLVQSATHVIFLWAWSHYRQSAPDDVVFGTITLIHSIGGQLFSLVIWGALTWRVWLGWPRRPTPVQS